MESVAIDLDPSEAKRLYHEYLTHRHFETAMDVEIRRTYREIAKGKTVIKALESVATAGMNEKGLPKLALMRADQPECWLMINRDTVRMAPNRARAIGWGRRVGPEPFEWRRDQFTGTAVETSYGHDYRAIMPMIPAHLRPKHALENYHVLWEAEWSRIVPRDPLLLRRLGEGDLWLVLAAWDLTEVERAALQARVAVN
jgi:hypothetical protein